MILNTRRIKSGSEKNYYSTLFAVWKRKWYQYCSKGDYRCYEKSVMLMMMTATVVSPATTSAATITNGPLVVVAADIAMDYEELI